MNGIVESDFYDQNSKYIEIITGTGKTMKLYDMDCTIGMDFFPDHYFDVVLSLQQVVDSMEIDLEKIHKIDNGLVGIKVIKKVRCNDIVYKVKKIDNNTFQKCI